jgi:Flp pilus assembly pilin Flp
LERLVLLTVSSPRSNSGGESWRDHDNMTKESNQTMTSLLRNLWMDDQGQDLIEYTLLMAFVALASAALFISSGTSVSKIWSTTNSQLSAAAVTAAS